MLDRKTRFGAAHRRCRLEPGGFEPARAPPIGLAPIQFRPAIQGVYRGEHRAPEGFQMRRAHRFVRRGGPFAADPHEHRGQPVGL